MFIAFVLGIFSSIIGSYILNMIGLMVKFIPPKLRKSFDREFANQKRALTSIKKSAKKSTTIKVLSMKGDTFSYPGDAGDLRCILESGPQTQKYLISDPNNPYVQVRAKELDNNNFKKGIENSLQNFYEMREKNHNISIKEHTEILRFRLIIFDECLYFSFQPTNAPGRYTPMQRYKKDSSGYLALNAYFDDLWSKY